MSNNSKILKVSVVVMVLVLVLVRVPVVLTVVTAPVAVISATLVLGCDREAPRPSRSGEMRLASKRKEISNDQVHDCIQHCGKTWDNSEVCAQLCTSVLFACYPCHCATTAPLNP